jgi:hypothetical protein
MNGARTGERTKTEKNANLRVQFLHTALHIMLILLILQANPSSAPRRVYEVETAASPSIQRAQPSAGAPVLAIRRREGRYIGQTVVQREAAERIFDLRNGQSRRVRLRATRKFQAAPRPEAKLRYYVLRHW